MRNYIDRTWTGTCIKILFQGSSKYLIFVEFDVEKTGRLNSFERTFLSLKMFFKRTFVLAP